MISVSDFRKRLRADSVDDIVRDLYLTGPAQHMTEEAISAIGQHFCAQFKASDSELQIYVVGSAKLGFSTVEKKFKDGTVLPRYRSFGPDSDIDFALVHTFIFDALWQELTDFAHQTPYWPWGFRTPWRLFCLRLDSARLFPKARPTSKLR